MVEEPFVIREQFDAVHLTSPTVGDDDGLLSERGFNTLGYSVGEPAAPDGITRTGRAGPKDCCTLPMAIGILQS